MPFVDMANPDVAAVHQYNAYAPYWRTAVSGLNLEGICRHRSCEAYGQEVIANLGYGAYNLVGYKAQCPRCKRDFRPVGCGFDGCDYDFIG